MHPAGRGVALALLVTVLAACSSPTAGGSNLHLPSVEASLPTTSTGNPSSASIPASSAAVTAPASPARAARAIYEALVAEWSPRYGASLAAEPEVADPAAWRAWADGVAVLLLEFRRSVAALAVDAVADEERAEFLSSIDAEIRAYRDAAEATDGLPPRLSPLDRLRRDADAKLADFVRALAR